MNYMKMMDLYFGFFHKVRKELIKRSDRRQCKNRLSGEVVLTKQQEKQIHDFYKPYCKITTIFHQMYYEKTGLFSEKYIPIDIYTNVIDEYFNSRAEGKYLDNKCYYGAIFNGLRQPEFTVCRVGGFWYNSEMKMIDENEVKTIISAEKELFVKAATESYGGQGVKYITNEEKDFFEQFEDFAKKTKGDVIAQRAIKQHKDLAVINDSSVNTIRIISLLTKDGPKIYSSLLRVGMKGKKVDNYTSGGLTVGINHEGILNKYAYNSKGERFDKHPSNDFVFEGYKVPCYEKAREMVKKAHPMVPHFRLVSFDIAIAEDGEPVFVEANLCKGSVEIHEFNNGPLFGEDTKKVLDEVFGVSKD